MKLSIVATLFRSAEYLHEFHKRASIAAAELAKEDFEIILVNDGSPDSSLEIAIELSKRDEHVVVVDLSRNFGHHKAMMTGLDYAEGDLIFLLDCDLEESPEWLLDFSWQMSELDCDVVYGVQFKRKGGVFEQLSGGVFYRIFDIATGLHLPKNIVTARLMSRRYVRALVAHRDQEIFLAGLWHITGFAQSAFVVHKGNSSDSTYNLRRKLSVFVNSITSFSNVPLKAIFYVGLSISTLAMIYISYIVFSKLFIEAPLSGWTSIMASVWLLGGMIISFLGIIGIYLAKIYSETKDRPYTIVRNVHGRK